MFVVNKHPYDTILVEEAFTWEKHRPEVSHETWKGLKSEWSSSSLFAWENKYQVIKVSSKHKRIPWKQTSGTVSFPTKRENSLYG